MSDSRQQFEAWTQESRDQLEIYTNGALKGEYCDLEMQYAWRAWQAAEQETARRCAELVEGQGAIGGHRLVMADAIRKEFPKAFK